MGYTTNFIGQFKLDKQLTLDDFNWLKEFAEKDHRDEAYHPEYSYYCQWIPTKDGRGIEWDGNEKFYDYIEWLIYLIDSFFRPKGYILSGTVAYQGEEVDDCGNIIVKDNEVSKIAFEAQNLDIKDLVRKGLEQEEERAYWYLEQIAQKLGVATE